MVHLISIHIPKTGGTSFYHILQKVYGDKLSISYKRKDLGGFPKNLTPEIEVIHGHFHYPEVKKIHQDGGARMICWLRDPAERVYSNYRFFIQGLKDPTRNPKQYQLNKHRINETLMEYASLPENQNRMSHFIRGITPEDFFFIGFLENFDADIEKLGTMLDWPKLTPPKLNRQKQSVLSIEDRTKLYELNHEDLALVEKAKAIYSNVQD